MIFLRNAKGKHCLYQHVCKEINITRDAEEHTIYENPFSLCNINKPECMTNYYLLCPLGAVFCFQQYFCMKLTKFMERFFQRMTPRQGGTDIEALYLCFLLDA